MKKEKLFLNRERFLKEMEIHKGKAHPEIIHKGHHAKLDRQSDIAAILNVSRATLGNWLNGSNSITEDHLEELAELFGCDWQYLCNKQNHRSTKGLVLDSMKEHSELLSQWVYDWEHPDKHNKPLIDYYEFEDAKTVSCQHYPVDKLIRDIVRMGGYELIIEGLKDISDLIKA